MRTSNSSRVTQSRHHQSHLVSRSLCSLRRSIPSQRKHVPRMDDFWLLCSRKHSKPCATPQSGSVPETNLIPGLDTPAVSTKKYTTAPGYQWPDVDWRLYKLDLLFVDRTDTIRARLSAGIFDRIAEWNGFGRALYCRTAGTHARPAEPLSLSQAVALMTATNSIGVSAQQFTRPPELFDVTDLDRYDIVIAMDSEVRDTMLSQVQDPAYAEYYSAKVCLLTTFSHYEMDSTVLAAGGTALLPRQLSSLLRPVMARSKAVVDISVPCLSSTDSSEQLDETIQTMVLATAGLVKYLSDAYPENLPEYDPLE